MAEVAMEEEWEAAMEVTFLFRSPSSSWQEETGVRNSQTETQTLAYHRYSVSVYRYSTEMAKIWLKPFRNIYIKQATLSSEK